MLVTSRGTPDSAKLLKRISCLYVVSTHQLRFYLKKIFANVAIAICMLQTQTAFKKVCQGGISHKGPRLADKHHKIIMNNVIIMVIIKILMQAAA